MNISMKSMALAIGMSISAGAALAASDVPSDVTGVVIRDLPVAGQPPASLKSANGGDIVYTLIVKEKGSVVSTLTLAPDVINKVQATSIVLVPYLKSAEYDESTSKIKKNYGDIKVGTTFTVRKSVGHDGRIASYLAVNDVSLTEMARVGPSDGLEIDMPSVSMTNHDRTYVQDIGADQKQPLTIWEFEAQGKAFTVTVHHR